MNARWLALLASCAFSSSAAAQVDYTFLIFGDSGKGDEEQRSVARAMRQACDQHACNAAMVLGDLIYNNGVKAIDDPKFATHFEQPYSVLGPFPFWMAPGNHDYKRKRSVGFQIAYTKRSQRWRMPAAHFPVGGLPSWLRIYSLDTTPIYDGSTDPKQLTEARDAFGGCKDTPQGWRLLAGHHPIYSNGKRHGDNPTMGRYLDAFIRECNVQVFFAGHDHHQEHISTPSFEQFIQGAAAEARAVNTVTDSDQREQQFVAAARGFAIAKFTATTMDVYFFEGTDGAAKQIYHCRATLPEHACMKQ